jgi:hypothetical protein
MLNVSRETSSIVGPRRGGFLAPDHGPKGYPPDGPEQPVGRMGWRSDRPDDRRCRRLRSIAQAAAPGAAIGCRAGRAATAPSPGLKLTLPGSVFGLHRTRFCLPLPAPVRHSRDKGASPSV